MPTPLQSALDSLQRADYAVDRAIEAEKKAADYREDARKMVDRAKEVFQSIDIVFPEGMVDTERTQRYQQRKVAKSLPVPDNDFDEDEE